MALRTPSTRPSVRSSARVRFASLCLLALTGILGLLISPSARPMSPPPPPTVWYVKYHNDQQLQDGHSWATAFSYFDDALQNQSLLPGEQIWVAHGVYRPQNPSTGFVLHTPVKIYGAFVGTEGSVDTRLGTAAQTILEGAYTSGLYSNAKHVLHISPVSENPVYVVLDSLTIQGGNSGAGNWTTELDGGGILAEQSDLVLRACAIKGNVSAGTGGGVCFQGGYGGQSNLLQVIDCELSTNQSYFDGGGLSAYKVEGDIVNSQFSSNSATYQYGGGAYLKTVAVGAFRITNATFWANTTSSAGAAVGLGDGTAGGAATATLVNCTMSDNSTNTAQDGQAVFATPNSQSRVYNCILAFNGSAHGTLNPIGGPSVFEFTDFWAPPNPLGILNQNGNMEADPFFRRHSLGGLTLLAGSACLDSADYDRIPVDTFDIDDDGDYGEFLPLDLLGSNRLVNRPEGDSGHDSSGNGFIYLDRGAYEKP